MNKYSIVNKLRIRASELNVSFNDVLSQFFYDEFLKLLSMSKYNENFLLKGVMLVAYKIGLQNRSTRDIDFLINGLDFKIENMRNIISDIVSMHTNEVWYELIGNWELIRLDDIYGGARFHLIDHVSNIRLPFTLDIATGNPIYPIPKKEKYRTLLGDCIYLYFYSLESVVAEKLQTILARAENNTRMKDFYDIYIIFNNNGLELESLKLAIRYTFSYRHTSISKKNALDITKLICENPVFEERWIRFQNKNTYVMDITFDSICDCLKELICNTF